MAFVQFSRVSLAFGDRDILKEVSLNLAAGSRAALAGANGAGKSTLMKVIAGKIAADSGDRAVQKGCRVSYLPQSGIVHAGKTLREEAETAYASILLLIAKMDELGRELEKSTGDSGATRVLLEEHHRIHEEIENSGYYRREAVIYQGLEGLGFSPDDMARETGEFSGGWQMRIALAKILLENPDIMLLDEPTNYLDIEARTWLESWLKSFSGGCLLVSHDRYFLDVTVNEVYEIFQGKLKRYVGNYSAYERTRAVELEGLVKRYEAQQEEIEKTEALIRRFRYKATKAAFAQELIKRLEKMERIVIPDNLKRINITFPPPPHSGRVALVLEGIGKSYGARRVISGLDLTLEAGEKLLVAGPNGAGKTTLLRIIAGGAGTGEDGVGTDITDGYEGTVKYGAGIVAGYFSQDAAENLTGSQTVEQYIEAEAPTYLIPRVRNMLGAFLFHGDDVFKPLSVLSGGEKSRLALLRMLLKPMNLLILDEPTNHLDIQSKDMLLDCLKAFAGTIVFVSHDRGFMEALSTKTLGLSSLHKHRLFYGNYAYYLDRLEREAAGTETGGNADDNSGDGASPAAGDGENRSPAASAEEPSSGGSSREQLPSTILIKASERRERDKQRQTLVRRMEREEAAILKAMEALETEKAHLEGELARPDVYSSGEKAKAVKARLDECSAALEAKSLEWEAIAVELEKILAKP
ncbi:MAG: ABC-F family ATP-binding cassette domain-containing protein [Treponema sp.]|jgi:ATP-binding cassette subfamily F protein 3|nr:ABC-F family ATP-binding cassette domain-containing protein [Treponema sp.]